MSADIFFSASKQGPQDPPAAGPQPQQPGEFPEKQKKNPFHFPDEHLIIYFPIPPDLAGSRDLWRQRRPQDLEAGAQPAHGAQEIPGIDLDAHFPE